MSSILFFFIMIGFTGIAVVFPFGGLLFYIWLELLSPQLMMYGPLQSIPYSWILGGACFIGWLFQEKAKFRQIDAFVVLLTLFTIWISITTVMAVFPEPAYVKWDRTIKILAAGLLLALMLNSRNRVEAFLWTLAIIFGLLAFRAAIRTIATGGGGGLIVVGMGGFLGDRNVLALSLAMAFPLMLCLGKYSNVFPRNRLFSITVFSGAIASLIGVLGTQSRGGVLSLIAVGAVMVMFTQKKMLAAFLATLVSLIILVLAPEAVFERMATIGDYEKEGSAAGRVNSWIWAWNYFLGNPLGGGFGVFRLNVSSAEKNEYGWLEAHSTIFEILAENGFIGTVLFIILMFISAKACMRSLKNSRIQKDVYVERISQTVLAMLAGLYLGSAFLSLSTSPLFFYMFVLSCRLKVMLQVEEKSQTKQARRVYAQSMR
jgi:putative inorganic carbon (hco3(-)) transporter